MKKRKKEKPLLTWGRAWCDRKHKRYYAVYVWRNNAAMYNRVDELSKVTGRPRTARNYVAMVQGWRWDRKTKDISLGLIHFTYPNLKAGIIAHELGHALAGWCSAVGIRIPTQTHRDDERMAECLETMMKAVCRMYYRIKEKK